MRIELVNPVFRSVEMHPANIRSVGRYAVSLVGNDVISLAVNERLSSCLALCKGFTDICKPGLVLKDDVVDQDAGRVADAAAGSGVRAEVHAFLHDMPERLAAADLVVSRAGATTVAELTSAGRPSLLVPYPFAADDHQRVNARTLERAGAAVVIDPEELDAAALAAAVRELVGTPGRLARMANASRALGRPDAAADVAAIVLRLAGGGR